MTPRAAARPAVALAAIAVILLGCGGSPTATRSSTTRAITVFAAASLTNVFGAEALAFTQHSRQRVTFSFAGSQELVSQIRQGAPADVLATADPTTMGKVPRGASATVFARNRLVIATAKGNPSHIRSLVDLARHGLTVVLAAPSVPAGKYADEALTAAHVSVHAKSFEDNVRGVLTKVQLGEADAGIVYATDVASTHGAVDAVPIPTSPVATYPILAVHPSGNAFVQFLLSAAGQAILRQHGFLPPS